MGTSRQRPSPCQGVVSSTKSVGTERVETREGQGEGEPSGPTSKASGGTDCRTGSSVTKEASHRGLDELAEHIEAPNMGAGGSHRSGHNDARSMPHTNVLRKRQPGRNQCFLRDKPRPCRQRSLCSHQRVPRCSTSISRTSSVDTSATSELDERRVTVKKTYREQRLCRKKEEACELFQRQPTLMRKTRENFETKFREKVLGGIYSNSKDEQEKDLQSWVNELEKVAQEEERRLEAFEKKRMGGEDARSRNRQAWDRISQSVQNLVSRRKPTRRRETKRERTLKGLGRTRTTSRQPGGRRN